jgi:hypothetical protein
LALILAHVAEILLDILECAESSFTADYQNSRRHQPLRIADILFLKHESYCSSLDLKNPRRSA